MNSIKADQLFIQQEQQRHVTLANAYFNEFMGVCDCDCDCA